MYLVSVFVVGTGDTNLLFSLSKCLIVGKFVAKKTPKGDQSGHDSSFI